MVKSGAFLYGGKYDEIISEIIVKLKLHYETNRMTIIICMDDCTRVILKIDGAISADFK